jgi:fatty acid elongase 3
MQWESPTKGATSLSHFLSLLSERPVAVLQPGYTPASDARIVVIAAALYLLVLSLLHRVSPSPFARAFWFVAVAALHNAALCVASFAMLVGVTGAVRAEIIESGSVASTLCNPSGRLISPRLTYWLYLFYISKFWELLDTVILVLRGRPLTLLHVWHHASVMFEIYFWLEFDMVLGMYGMIFNTLVHTFMYSYYCAALLKVRVPWKQALTSLQIVQFCVSFVSLVPYAYVYKATPGGCTGGPGLVVSAICNGSFLLLFIQFFRRTYAPPKAKST